MSNTDTTRTVAAGLRGVAEIPGMIGTRLLQVSRWLNSWATRLERAAEQREFDQWAARTDPWLVGMVLRRQVTRAEADDMGRRQRRAERIRQADAAKAAAIEMGRLMVEARWGGLTVIEGGAR